MGTGSKVGAAARPDMQDALDARGIGVASLHEAAGKIGALPSAIKPLNPEWWLRGRAFPVLCPVGDNLWLHHAIYAAGEGDVLVVVTGEDTEFGYWGDIMTRAAERRRLGGLVIQGGVRDSASLARGGLPIFAQTVCIAGTGKDPRAGGALNVKIRIGAVDIWPGDMIVGDADGVVCIPAARMVEVIAAAKERESKERVILQRLEAGETTIGIYGLPDVPVESKGARA